MKQITIGTQTLCVSEAAHHKYTKLREKVAATSVADVYAREKTIEGESAARRVGRIWESHAKVLEAEGVLRGFELGLVAVRGTAHTN